jgi:hypothetical protein
MIRALLLVLCFVFAGCAAGDGGDTKQKWSKTHGYNFGFGPLPQPPTP